MRHGMFPVVPNEPNCPRLSMLEGPGQQVAFGSVLQRFRCFQSCGLAFKGLRDRSLRKDIGKKMRICKERAWRPDPK